jgi:general stress protein 26
MARQERTGTDAARALIDIVAQFRTAMLVNANTDGRHRARPMTIANRDADEPLPAAPGGKSPQQVSFVTSRTNGLVEDLEAEPAVCITMQDGAKYVCLAGKARISQDRERLRGLWSEAFDLWFRGGPDDPDVVLIDCDIDFAEYWDGSGIEGVRLLAEAGRARLTGDRIDPRRAGRHAEVDPRDAGARPRTQ